MIFQGEYLTVNHTDNGILDLCFTAQTSVNKFNLATLEELGQALQTITQLPHCNGLMLSSAKDSFIVGADITEFNALFAHPEAELRNWLARANTVFNTLEDLPVPTISLIQGYALGGGCECILATDFRIADDSAKIGLPETKLGLIPGFGGTVRLPRLIGADNALEWIATGQDHDAQTCLKVGVIDAITTTDHLKKAGMSILQDALTGEINWQTRRQQKQSPLLLDEVETQMSFATARAFVSQKAGPHYPAPMAAVDCIEKAAKLSRNDALTCEAQAFVKLAKGKTANALIGLFLNDQYIKSLAKKANQQNQPSDNIAVIGAGIMGGGIAYQAAYCGKKVIMQDINTHALDQGMREATKRLNGLVDKQKITSLQLGQILNRITPTLDPALLTHSEIVIEAVIEKKEIKQNVLQTLEKNADAQTIFTSNTSTIPIDELAKGLKRPEQFCGMHFFNPVHRMPLVEVIRGEKTSDETVNQVVALAAAMKKSPIVVKDCPGFFVNRVLFPYLFALGKLLDEGIDYHLIDQVMEKHFGWPMGPAYLLDVVGLDTAQHASKVMAQGFPKRMGNIRFDALDKLLANNALGQKNGNGFYTYSLDKKGKIKKSANPTSEQLIYPQGDQQQIDAQDIIDRMMIPMLNEVCLCLEEGIIDTPAQADMALIYGLGFPPFRGGACRYLDHVGIEQHLQRTQAWVHLGSIYQPGQMLLEMARENKSFYPDTAQGVKP